VARKVRVKRQVQGKSDRLRLSVFKTSLHTYAQIIDDKERRTLISESTLSEAFRATKKHGGNVAAAVWVGKSLGEKAAEKGIKEVYYDRNGFRYTGRLKALADAVREKGVKF
jgi:large subunit ribosomal protein L18